MSELIAQVRLLTGRTRLEHDMTEPRQKVSKEEFERTYAESFGVTVKWLHSRGQFAVPCDCGDELWCSGWQMVCDARPVI